MGAGGSRGDPSPLRPPSAPFSTPQHPSAPLSTLQHPSAPFSTPQHPSAPLSTVQHATAPFSTRQHRPARFSTLQHPSAPWLPVDRDEVPDVDGVGGIVDADERRLGTDDDRGGARDSEHGPTVFCRGAEYRQRLSGAQAMIAA